MTITIDELLKERVCHKGDTVTVNALELKALVLTKRELEHELRATKNEFERVSANLTLVMESNHLLEAEKEVMIFDTPRHVKLDIKG